MAKTVFDVLKEDIEKLMSNRKAAVINGSPKTFEQYREEVGVLKGLGLALDAVETRARAAGENDE